MAHLTELEKNHLNYADLIEELVEQPRTNEQLVDLVKTVATYLRASGKQLHNYNEHIDHFIGVMSKLP